MNSKFMSGLEGTIAAQTSLSHVDGQAGELVIRGFSVEELATRATYEEAAYLLWHDRLPDAQELAAFKRSLAARRELPQATVALLRVAAEQVMEPMDALCMATGTLGLRSDTEPHDAPEHDNARDAGVIGRDAYNIVGRFPTIVAAYWRLLQGHDPIAPRGDLDHAANYLYMLSGEAPSAARVRALETYLVALIDHALNASTFTARTIISTQSDLISAVAGAIGALKGPLHGGAPGPALQTVLDIGATANAEPMLRRKLQQGERLMGFGYRDYEVRDPRTYVLSAAAKQVYTSEQRLDIYELAQHVERTAVRLLAEYKPGRHLYANVEFYAGLLLHGVGLPAALFTPTFAIARTAGWVVHSFEQRGLNRLMQPQSVYVGRTDRQWAPIEERDLSTNPTGLSVLTNKSTNKHDGVTLPNR
jgi:citrate synthase